MEPGSEVRWTLAGDGNATVNQSQGNVFYRVERGGRFLVETPAGSVRVLGTCFRVEVDEMKPLKAGMVGAVAGATLAAAALVTVYEGRVVAASSGTERTVEAGEVARVSSESVPTSLGQIRPSARYDHPPILRESAASPGRDEGQTVSHDTYARLYDETEQLRSRVEELESRLDVEKAMRFQKQGTELEEPADLPAQYGKEAMLDAFQHAIAATGAPIELSTIDCTEYPCIVVGNVIDAPGTDTFDDTFGYLRDFLKGPGFEAYQENNSNRISVWRGVGDKNGEKKNETLFAITMYPESDEEARGEQLKQRIRYRTGEILDASRTNTE